MRFVHLSPFELERVRVLNTYAYFQRELFIISMLYFYFLNMYKAFGVRSIIRDDIRPGSCAMGRSPCCR